MGAALPSVDDFAGLRFTGLDSYDVLVLNYCAASGLPGTDRSNLDQWLDKRNEWAEQVRVEICRHLYRFDPQPDLSPTQYTYGNSLARFLCYFPLQVLQEDCAVRYHPQRKFRPDFCQPLDVFVHGIMDDEGEGGTCASMPVVYSSIGRRLGFPLYLVEAKGHLFFRWHNPHGTTLRWTTPDLTPWVPPDRFNVDGSGDGIAYHDDAFYLTWPEVLNEFDLQHGRYLRSMNTKEVLASFLMERGECFWDLRNRTEALRAYHYARQLAPDELRYEWLHAKRTSDLRDMEARSRAIEDEIRNADRRRIAGASGHPANCGCRRCRERPPTRQHPEHGPSCQCLHCRQDRLAVQHTGIPGHPHGCLCAGCRPPTIPRTEHHFVSDLRETFPGLPEF